MTIRRLWSLLACLLVVFCLPSHATGSLIAFVAAETDMDPAIPSSFIKSTINGLGLPGYPPHDPSDLHDNADPSNAWLSGAGTTTGNIYLTLAGSALVDRIYLWNMNSGDTDNLPPPTSRTPGSTGIQLANLYHSLDLLGTATTTSYTPISGNPFLFSQETGTTSGAQFIEFTTPILANFLKLEIVSNWGDLTQTGFSEIAYREVVVPGAIPEPSSLGVFGGLALAYRAMRRKRTTKS
ncbi:MAG: PEP-CTERM sorting domain-containing protein [Pirellulaceae bacterium]